MKQAMMRASDAIGILISIIVMLNFKHKGLSSRCVQSCIKNNLLDVNMRDTNQRNLSKTGAADVVHKFTLIHSPDNYRKYLILAKKVAALTRT